MNRTPLVMLMLTLLVAPLWVGCQQTPPKPRPQAALTDDEGWLPRQRSYGLVEQRNGPIPDVPVPVGFKPVPSKSSVSVAPDGVRNVDMLIQGWSTLEDARKFYRQNTLLHDWQPVEFGGLDFVKGPERLTVSLSRGIDRIINIRVRIGPRPGG